jgi:AcrR family transcriptional regulator
MVATRTADAPAVRDQVLAAATRLFAARGFEGTTLQAVADEVGVTKPAVLHHFPSKEALHRAVLDGLLGHWGEALPRLLLAATASEDRFDAVFGEVHRFFATEPDRARLVVREILDRPAEVKQVLRGALRPWIGAIAAYIRSGQEHGRHAPDVDPEAYVLQVLQLVLASIASASVCRSALEGDAAEVRARYDAEVRRIAKASLFTTPVASQPPTPRPPPRGRSRR